MLPKVRTETASLRSWRFLLIRASGEAARNQLDSSLVFAAAANINSTRHKFNRANTNNPANYAGYETARKAFYLNGSTLFNNIPSEMKEYNSVVIFKNRIFEFYRSSVF